MMNENTNKDQIEKLARQITQDQEKTTSAEKRVKVDTTFNKAVKKMGQTPPPKKEVK